MRMRANIVCPLTRLVAVALVVVALVVVVSASIALAARDAGGQGQSQGQGLTVAAAADLQSVFPTVAAQFEKETGRHVTVTFGSSGNFFAQIQNGAPFDLFFSADIDYPKRLDSASLVEPDTLYEYATGKIVLWTRKDSGIDPGRGLQVLRDANVRRIAIANPEHAPYGRAALAALRHEQLYDAVQPKIVLGENISQTAQFVQSGNAEVGIIALSLALAPAAKELGSYAEIPASFYPPIQQAAVILKSSPNKALAREFLAFLKRGDVVQTMRSFGFAVPEAATAVSK
jgi:molybdate transport system substrate-binding protein